MTAPVIYPLAIDALLVILVLAAWLGSAGFARLRAPLDRLHCVTFVNTVCGLSLTIIAFVADGVSDRALKVLLITGFSLLSGAAASHVIGRAWLVRQGDPEAVMQGGPQAGPDGAPAGKS